MMRSLLSLSIFLLLASCAKKDAEPIPALEGNWAGETVTNMRITGAVREMEPSTTIHEQRMVITADSIFRYSRFIFNGVDTEYLYSAKDYVREGNTLNLRSSKMKAQLEELTAHSITLMYRYPDVNFNDVWHEQSFTYSR